MQLSILIPSFNYGRFIEDAVDSARAQGIEAEIIVQDNQSSDDTVDILERPGYVDKWESVQDDGQSDALNRALSKAQGTWIAWLNADEFYLPQGLSTLLASAAAGDSDVVYGDAVFVDEQGRLERLLPQHRFSSSILRRYGVIVPSCSAIFRRETLGEDPFDVRLRGIMDLALLLRLSEEGARFNHVPYPVGAFRVHGARVTAAPTRSMAPEFDLLSAEFGSSALYRPRVIGRALHGGRKLVEGAYFRQWRARSCRGCDMRWFASQEGANGWRCLTGRDVGSGHESPG